jgi:hypothetical protein
VQERCPSPDARWPPSLVHSHKPRKMLHRTGRSGGIYSPLKAQLRVCRPHIALRDDWRARPTQSRTIRTLTEFQNRRTPSPAGWMNRRHRIETGRLIAPRRSDTGRRRATVQSRAHPARGYGSYDRVCQREQIAWSRDGRSMSPRGGPVGTAPRPRRRNRKRTLDIAAARGDRTAVAKHAPTHSRRNLDPMPSAQTARPR